MQTVTVGCTVLQLGNIEDSKTGRRGQVLSIDKKAKQAVVRWKIDKEGRKILPYETTERIRSIFVMSESLQNTFDGIRAVSSAIKKVFP